MQEPSETSWRIFYCLHDADSPSYIASSFPDLSGLFALFIRRLPSLIPCVMCQCKVFDDGKFNLLVADLQTSCDTQIHASYQIFAAILVLCYPLGIPLLFYFWMRQFKDSLDDPRRVESEMIQLRNQNRELHDHPVASYGLHYRPRYDNYMLCFPASSHPRADAPDSTIGTS